MREAGRNGLDKKLGSYQQDVRRAMSNLSCYQIVC